VLENINPNQEMDKKTYKAELRSLETTLAALQQRVIEERLPIVIVFEGWGGSGKGTCISRLVNPLDPRYFDVRISGKLTEDKLMRPFLWSFWTYLPPKGQIVIMDKSWHRLMLPNVRDSWQLSNMETHGFTYDVNAFERKLTEAGYIIIKFFLHISKEEQEKRFDKLSENPSTSWRVEPHDREQNKNYNQHMRHFEKMLRLTNTDVNPWNIIEADNKRFAACKIMRIIAENLERRLDEKEAEVEAEPEKPEKVKVPLILSKIQPDETIENDEYKLALKEYQGRIRLLGNKMYAKRRSVVIVYEGWDAAGKGGNIKRLTSEMDPRGYAVVPIAAPNPHELSRHYLWRFMVKMPKDGHLTIFDRSWYGRVLVERVEGLTPEPIWRRSYGEINDMEQHLVGHGTVILKFWLHIDKEEQLRRFESRKNDPLKQHKITEEDWRNREKWDLYEAAVDEMLHRTHNSYAPWIIVESNCKKYARIKVLQTVTDALEDALR